MMTAGSWSRRKLRIRGARRFLGLVAEGGRGAISCFFGGVSGALWAFRCGPGTHLRSSSVAPSTFFRVSIMSSESLWKVTSSRGLMGPKTSLTACSTLVIRSRQPRCSNHQLNARKLRFVSKSAPSASPTLPFSWFSRLIVESFLRGAAREKTLDT